MSKDFDLLGEFITKCASESNYVSERLANISVAIVSNGSLIYSGSSGFSDASAREPSIRFTPTTRIRFASVSKTITAQIVLQLANEKAISLEDNIFKILKLDDQVDKYIPIFTLLNHTSSLTDAAGWYVDLPKSLKQMVLDNFNTIISRHEPGEYFSYCNLNYVLLGWLIEEITETRFHEVARKRVLDPLCIGGGFNWSGVSAADREHRAPACKKVGQLFVDQVDSLESVLVGDVVDRLGRPVSIDETRLGEDVSIFSPHAGMRMSVEEAAALAWSFAARDAASTARRKITWQLNQASDNGSHGDGMFAAFGQGLQFFADLPFYPSHLYGHYGDALGFRGGAWFDATNNIAFAYTMNGFVDFEGRYPEDFFRPQEAGLFSAIFQAISP